MASLERLRAVIDAHGADPKRWPQAERSALEALAARQENAVSLRDARALDAVLARSGQPEAAGLDRLKARILAAAGEHQEIVRSERAPATVTSLGERRKLPAASRLRGAWPAAAALAASLLIGVVLGASELGQPAVESLIASAGYDTNDELTLDPLGVGDEELL